MIFAGDGWSGASGRGHKGLARGLTQTFWSLPESVGKMATTMKYCFVKTYVMPLRWLLETHQIYCVPG